MDNPWIVGIGVTVIGGLILNYIVGILKKKTDNAPVSMGVVQANPEEVISSTNLTPTKIIDEIQKAPVYQRDGISKNYQGVKVNNWITTLQHINKGKGGMIHLMLFDDGHYPWVYVDVREKDYPKLKLMKEDERIKVSGIIKNVENNVIELEKAKLILSE